MGRSDIIGEEGEEKEASTTELSHALWTEEQSKANGQLSPSHDFHFHLEFTEGVETSDAAL